MKSPGSKLSRTAMACSAFFTGIATRTGWNMDQSSRPENASLLSKPWLMYSSKRNPPSKSDTGSESPMCTCSSLPKMSEYLYLPRKSGPMNAVATELSGLTLRHMLNMSLSVISSGWSSADPLPVRARSEL